MPDITMCVTNDCPKRESCYRYRAIPTGYNSQSYAAFEEACNKNNYEYFWDIGDRKDITYKK